MPEMPNEKDGQAAENMIHSGKIVVEGVNSKGELMGVAEILLNQLKLELMLAGGN
jgi:hypothetical protein